MERGRHILPLVVLVLLVLPIVAFAGRAPTQASRANSQPPQLGGRLPIQGEGGITASTQDFTGQLVRVLERDVIKAIDFPPHAPAGSKAHQVLVDDEPVIGVEIDGVARAYPLRVLGTHEVVNDTLAGQPIVVTFCPLCYTGLVFDRHVDGELRTFGVSGMLLNSNLVLYDRQEESLWSQVTGEAIRGPDRGAKLARVDYQQLEWGMWREIHPDTEVMDFVAFGGAERYPQQGFVQHFGSSARGLIPLDVPEDLDGKELVLGVKVDSTPVAYPLKIHAGRVVNDMAGGLPIAVVADRSGASARAFQRPDAGVELRLSEDRSVLTDLESGHSWRASTGEAIQAPGDLEVLESTVSFWFAWAAFFPESRIVLEG